METAQLLALLIPALTQIAHDAITGYYRLHGDQSVNTYADATDAEKQATAAAVTNHLNGNPDNKTVPGVIAGTVVEAARGALEGDKVLSLANYLPIPEVTEIHAPAIDPSTPVSTPATAESTLPVGDKQPWEEPPPPHFPPM